MTEKTLKSPITRRKALGLIGAAGGALASGANLALAQTPAMPAVRKKAEIKYWTWADNPGHQKRLVDAVDAFNKENGFINVALDAGSLTMEVRQKIIVAFAAGAAPDVGGVVQTNAQDYFDTGILDPIDPFFEKWADKSDIFPSVVDAMRLKPNQPVLYLPIAILPYVLYYRADWFEEAKLNPPSTYEEFIAAAKTMTKGNERYGYALRGLDYYAVQPIEPILASGGVKFVDESGKVDLDSPKAVEIVKRWVEMYTKDKSCQPTAIADRYPQLFALMEQGKAAQWIYGTHASPQLDKALGSRIQPVRTPIPVGGQPRTLANPEGNFIVSSSKEKEAGWEFLKYLSVGAPAMSLGPERGLMPIRKSLSQDPVIQNNRFFKVAASQAEYWWRPPYQWKNWSNYQDKIAPFWQEALRETITVQQFQEKSAEFLRG